MSKQREQATCLLIRIRFNNLALNNKMKGVAESQCCYVRITSCLPILLSQAYSVAKMGIFNIRAPSLTPRLSFTVEDQLMEIQRKVDAIFHCTITTTLYIVIKSLFPLPVLRYVTGVIPFPSCKSFHGQRVNLRRLLQM